MIFIATALRIRKYKFGEVWGTPAAELIRSSDGNFRPTDAIFGEDGALYVADWHNVIIGHMQHNVRDPNRDKVHGRIYRVDIPRGHFKSLSKSMVLR